MINRTSGIDIRPTPLGQEVLDRIVAPLTAGIYTADVTKLSMQATMQGIAKLETKHGSLARATAVRRRKGEDSVERASTGARYGQFRAFQGGMIELINGIAKSLPQDTVKLNAKVNSIQRHGHRWTVSEAGTDHEFDHLVLAVPARVMAGLLEDVASTAAVELAKIESASTAIVILGVSKDDIQRPVETFGFVVPLSEKRRILAGSFASHKFDGRSPENHVLIRVFIGGAMQADLLDGTDQELVQLAREELSDLIGLKGEPLVTRVVWHLERSHATISCRTWRSCTGDRRRYLPNPQPFHRQQCIAWSRNCSGDQAVAENRT